MTISVTRSVLVGVAAVALLAGCAGATSSAAAGSATSTAASSSAAAAAPAGGTALSCSLAPASLVGSALGITGLGNPHQTGNSRNVDCAYDGTSNVNLTMVDGVTVAGMSTTETAMAQVGKISAVPGLGDEAFSQTGSLGNGGPSSNTIVALHGTVEITVLSTASLSGEKSLEQQLFTEIG